MRVKRNGPLPASPVERKAKAFDRGGGRFSPLYALCEARERGTKVGYARSKRGATITIYNAARIVSTTTSIFVSTS